MLRRRRYHAGLGVDVKFVRQNPRRKNAKGKNMENLKWKLSKTLKTAMRQRDIDTFTLAKVAEETYAATHTGGDLDVRQEVFKVIDEYATEVNLEILDLICKILGVGVKFGDGGDF